MKIRMMTLIGLGLLFVAGCVPGKAVYTIKTSEMRKALEGKPAHIRVDIAAEYVLSNAYRKVEFGGGRYTNELDVVKSIFDKQDRLFGLDFLRLGGTNDVAKFFVDEADGRLPTARATISVGAWISTEECFKTEIQNRMIPDACVLGVGKESEGFRLKSFCCGAVEENRTQIPKYLAYEAVCSSLESVLNILDLEKTHEEICGLLTWSPAIIINPEVVHEKEFVIIGDSDEPLHVTAKSALVNGKRVETFQGCVKRGETLRIMSTRYGEVWYSLQGKQ